MATLHPATLLGLAPRLGAIGIGSDATFTVVDWNRSSGSMHVQRTIVGGETVYEAA
jgi:imidazolonepropionase-like amidohydrolase